MARMDAAARMTTGAVFIGPTFALKAFFITGRFFMEELKRMMGTELLRMALRIPDTGSFFMERIFFFFFFITMTFMARRIAVFMLCPRRRRTLTTFRGIRVRELFFVAFPGRVFAMATRIRRRARDTSFPAAAQRISRANF